MSFISIIEKIAADVTKDIEIGAAFGMAAAPIVTALDPPVGAVLTLICSSIIKAEQLIPGDGKGSIKKQLASILVTANTPAGGPAPTAEQISATIDALVAALKAMAKPALPQAENPK